MPVLIGGFSERQYSAFLNPMKKEDSRPRHWISYLNLRNATIAAIVNRIVFAFLHRFSVYPNNAYLFNQFKSFSFKSIKTPQEYQAAAKILNRFQVCSNVDQVELCEIHNTLNEIKHRFRLEGKADSTIFNASVFDEDEILDYDVLSPALNEGKVESIYPTPAKEKDQSREEKKEDNLQAQGILPVLEPEKAATVIYHSDQLDCLPGDEHADLDEHFNDLPLIKKETHNEQTEDDDFLGIDSLFEDNIGNDTFQIEERVFMEDPEESLALLPMDEPEAESDPDVVELTEKDRLKIKADDPIHLVLKTLFPTNQDQAVPLYLLQGNPHAQGQLALGSGDEQQLIPFSDGALPISVADLQKALGELPKINNLSQFIAVGVEKGARVTVAGTALVGFNFFSALTAGAAAAGLQATATAGLLTAGGLVTLGATGAVVTEEVLRAIWNGEDVGVAFVEGLKAPVLLPGKIISLMMPSSAGMNGKPADQEPVVVAIEN